MLQLQVVLGLQLKPQLGNWFFVTWVLQLKAQIGDWQCVLGLGLAVLGWPRWSGDNATCGYVAAAIAAFLLDTPEDQWRTAQPH
jgi:hypothetical protein